MTSNSEAETQQRPASTKSCAEVASNEESSATVASSEVNKSNEQPESPLEQNELQKSDSSTENLLEENSTPKEHSKCKLEPTQHDITTIEEESDRDVNTVLDHTETKQQQEENKGYDTDIDRDIEIIEENENKCSRCLVEVFYCMTWYCRNIKNGLVGCFRRCRECDFKCNGSGSVDSDEQGDYVYSDLNETFNKDLSDDPGNSFEVVNARDSNTSEGLVLHGKYRGYDNSAIDVGQDNTGRNSHDKAGGHISHDNSSSHVKSGSDFGTNHVKSEDSHVSSGGDAATCHARSDVGHVGSANDHSSGHAGYDGHVSGGDDGCYSSGGDGGCDSGGGDCN